MIVARTTRRGLAWRWASGPPLPSRSPAFTKAKTTQ